MPQARAGLLPNVSRVGQPPTYNNYDATIKQRSRRSTSAATSTSTTRSSRRRSRCTASRTSSRYDQAKQQVAQADYTLGIAQQDLIIRVAVAYFDVLLARVQHRAGRAAEDRGVRAARAGEAQLRGRRRDDHRHQRSPGEVRPDRRAGDPARNDSTTGVTALRAIIGRYPEEPEDASGRGFEPAAARARTRSTTGSTSALKENLNVRVAAGQLRHRHARGRPRARRATIRRSTWSPATRRRAANGGGDHDGHERLAHRA